MEIKLKFKEWLKRYLWVEIIAILTAVVSGNISQIIFNNLIISAFIATWIDGIAYYGLMAYQDLRLRKKKDKKLKTLSYLKVLRDLLAEFGPAEYFDSVVLRPFFLAITPILVKDYSLAITIGSILASIVFYIPTIIGYETRKLIFKD